MLLSMEVDFQTVSDAILTQKSDIWYLFEIHIKLCLQVGRVISKYLPVPI